MTATMLGHALARWLALAAMVAVAGAVAGGAGAGCGDDDRPASFRYIHTAIFLPSCASVSCHTKENAQAAVRLDTVEAAYAVLVGRPCDGSSGGAEAPRNFVDPYRPERSRLMYLLEGVEVRRQMPPDRPLPRADIDLVERWILEGAPCN
jgi:hypothetical protein